MGTRQRSTLRHVAERAGVSVGTASAVFASKPSVSEVSRVAVLEAASQLGYRPPRAAAARLVSRLDAVGVLWRAEYHVGPSNPFFGPVIEGIQRAAAEFGLAVISEMLPEEEPGRRRLPAMLKRARTPALLVLGPVEPEYLTAMLRPGQTCVLVGDACAEIAADTVCPDDEQGGYAATRHLIELGHRDPIPAVITGGEESSSLRGRSAGYRRALAEAGLRPDDAYVRAGRLNADSGRAAMTSLLRLRRPPTAVFCCNDDMAIGALHALREHGIDVPAQCSVVGYDDTAMAAHTAPPLTTIAVDKQLLGMQAVWTAVQRATFPDISVRDLTIRVRLVQRASTAVRRED